MDTKTVTTLQQTALVKIVLVLCNRPEIRDLLDDRRLYMYNTKAELRKQKKAWRTIRSAIQEKVSSLHMSSILENLLVETTELILGEITNWVERYLWYYSNNLERIMKYLQWSSDGTIIESYTVYAIMDEKEPSHGPKYEKMELLYRFLSSRRNIPMEPDMLSVPRRKPLVAGLKLRRKSRLGK
ncbi:hypothetical protein AVEN_138410-1 [Araneus ventricosus]|uniref:Uncharacterized protein n=1 Tax=Araneus ventricosus TaxID=182803 RepID=A0A4Y2WSG4_ARAVE|nr:hypothetical protein AVEN_138410-1 [Araneus ventricosus]